MKKLFKSLLVTVVVLIGIVSIFTLTSLAADNVNQKWIGAWGTGATEIGVDGYSSITPYIGNVTMRTVISPTSNGSQVRFKISNLYGDEDLTLTRVTIARSVSGSKVDPQSIKIVTFNQGYQGITLGPGEEIYTDPVVFDVRAGENIAISIYAEKFNEIRTMGLSGADTYLSLGEDATSKESFGLLPNFVDNKEFVDIVSGMLGSDIDLNLAYSFIKIVPLVVNMDVLAQGNAYSVVVIGDSTVANEFPYYLSQQIGENGVSNVGVVGKGIIGNSLLIDGLGLGSAIYGDSMLDRFDVDALQASGVKYVIVKIGANDITHPVSADVVKEYEDKGGIKQPTAEEIIAGYKEVFRRCHEAGIKVVVIGITQWKGTTRDYFGSGPQYVRTDEEFEADWAIATAVNDWLSKTTEHDGYVSFNDISANPKDPAAFYPDYTIDGIHPSQSLQKIWAENFPLSLIGVGKAVNGIKLNDNAMGLYAGYGKKLVATVSPADAEDKTVIWSSTNPEVATVDENGYVKAIKDGTAYIICTTADGLFSDECYVRVVTAVKSVTLNRTTAGAYTTRSFRLIATVLPENATNKNVTWKSSNPKVATVDQNGVVTGVGSGTCYITVTTENRNLTATCRVTVVKKTEVTGITISQTTLNIYKNRTYNLSATISPANATYPQIVWSSSDTKVATVDSKGKVTAVGAGTAYITCSSYDNPMITKTCKVNVVVKTTGITLSNTAVGCYEGYTRTITANVLPADATNKKVTWASEDTSIATINSKGVITGIKPGVTYVTCTTNNGGFVAKCKVTVVATVKTTSVRFNQSSVKLDDGTLAQLNITVYPENATVKKVIYTSSNPNVAKVYSDGRIYGVTPGTATITAKTTDTGKTATCTVTVNPVYPTGVSLNPKSMTIEYGEVAKITATVAPSNCSYRSVTWKSSDPSAVYVSQYGYVKGMKAGTTATITCTTNSGKKVATCTVKVSDVKVTGVSLSKSAVTLTADQTYRLTATVAPANATNQTVIWESANTKIAKVSSNGVIVPVGDGTTIVSCTTKDGGFVAYCIVQVQSVKVLGVTLNKSSLIANRGASFTLIASVYPSNATNPAVTWKSTNTAVATVKNGVVTAVGVGVCEIKVYTVDGNYVATCKVQVV